MAHDSEGTVDHVTLEFINTSVYKTLDVNKLRKLCTKEEQAPRKIYKYLCHLEGMACS